MKKSKIEGGDQGHSAQLILQKQISKGQSYQEDGNRSFSLVQRGHIQFMDKDQHPGNLTANNMLVENNVSDVASVNPAFENSMKVKKNNQRAYHSHVQSPDTRSKNSIQLSTEDAKRKGTWIDKSKPLF